MVCVDYAACHRHSDKLHATNIVECHSFHQFISCCYMNSDKLHVTRAQKWTTAQQQLINWRNERHSTMLENLEKWTMTLETDNDTRNNSHLYLYVTGRCAASEFHWDRSSPSKWLTDPRAPCLRLLHAYRVLKAGQQCNCAPRQFLFEKKYSNKKKKPCLSLVRLHLRCTVDFIQFTMYNEKNAR